MSSGDDIFTAGELDEYLANLPLSPMELSVYAHARLLMDIDEKERNMCEVILISCKEIINSYSIPPEPFPELFQ